ALLHDEEGKWYDDNELRNIFFCKSALEIMKKFGWPPNIIHCGGFMTALIPLYIKTMYKREAVFSKSKIIFTMNDITFTDSLNKNFLKLASIHDSIKPEHMESFKSLNYKGCMRGGATYADVISFCNPKIEQKFVKELEELKGKTILSYGVTNSMDDYFELYEKLTDK
ncbi:MAG: glycogen/starch synthase, partial [Chitinophagaceae bacterium]